MRFFRKNRKERGTIETSARSDLLRPRPGHPRICTRAAAVQLYIRKTRACFCSIYIATSGAEIDPAARGDCTQIPKKSGHLPHPPPGLVTRANPGSAPDL